MEEQPNHRKAIVGHVVYYGDDCEDGIRYLSHDLDSSAAKDAFKAAKNDYTGFEFESQHKRESYILRYNRQAGNYTLEQQQHS